MEFDVTIAAIVQFTGNQTLDAGSQEIYNARVSPDKRIRYVFLKYDQNARTSEVEIFYNNHIVLNERIKNSDGSDITIYEPDGALPIFFSKFVLEENGKKVNSKRLFLITIGHGAGFTFFQETAKIIRALKDSNFIKENKSILADEQVKLFHTILEQRKDKYKYAANFSGRSKFIKGFDTRGSVTNRILKAFNTRELVAEDFEASFKDSEHHERYLTSFELADILTAALSVADTSVPPIDMIIHINCYLQTLESGYAFRKIAKYIAATQRTMPAFGIDYVSLFTQLSSDPQTPNLAIAKEIITRFEKKAIDRNDFKDVSLSINDTSTYEKIGVAITSLADWFRDNQGFQPIRRGGEKMPPILQLVNLVRNLPNMTPLDADGNQLTGLVELRKFFRLMKDELLPARHNPQIIEFINRWIVLDKLMAKTTIVHFFDITQHSRANPEGLNLFFPSQLTFNSIIPQTEGLREITIEYICGESKEFIEFTQISGWDEFLNSLLNPCQKPAP